VGSSATLGTDTSLDGNILAKTSITMDTGADLDGSALALNGAVTLDDNDITVSPSYTVPDQTTVFTGAWMLLPLGICAVRTSLKKRVV
jgi:hypothetical protein